MEKGCPCQVQAWSNSFFTKHPVRYPISRPHHRKLCANGTMRRKVFLTIVFMNLLLPPYCLAQRILGNGLEDRGMARGGGESGPCLPEQILTPVRTAFQKLIPTFNSRSLTIQLKTDSRIQLGPGDPSLVPFLQSYYSIALTKITAVKSSSSSAIPDGKLAYAAMLLYFNTEYSRFLNKIGVPLSCISYFLGAADLEAMVQLQQLAKSLQQRYSSQQDRDRGFKCLFGDGISGPQIMEMLKVTNEVTFTPSTYIQDASRDAATCEKIIFYMKDGSIMAKMPTLDMERRELAIPYLESSMKLGQFEVPFQIGRYIATGVNCLENDGQRWNFTYKVVEWMQNDVVYQIVQTPFCLPGFGGILPFILSVQDYAESLRNTRNTDQATLQISDYDYSIRAEDNSNLRSLNSDLQTISEVERAPTYILDTPPQVVQPKPRNLDNTHQETHHDHHGSSWFFTFFMLLILAILCCWAYSVLCGNGWTDCARCIRALGMRLKREGTKRRRRRRQPSYTVVPSETEETAKISETEDTSVYSYKPSEVVTEEEKPVPVKVEYTPSPPAHKHHHHHHHNKHHKKRHPIVEIHSTGNESIRLELTTDTECDDFITTVKGCNKCRCNESTVGSETCHMSELDLDLGDGDYDGDDNGTDTTTGQYSKRQQGEMSFVADDEKTPYLSVTDFNDGTTSTTTTSFKMSSADEKNIYDRYTGPNASRMKTRDKYNANNDDMFKASRLID